MKNNNTNQDNEDVEILYTKVDNISLDLAKYVPKFRQEKINQYIFDKDKKLCLGAWLLVQEIGNFNVAFAPTGKPYFTNSNIKFNISHSGSICICSYGKYNIGCDIEQIADYDDNFAKYCMRDNEINLINKNNKKFFDFWTMKESYIKALGQGLNINPLSISIKSIKDWYFYLFCVDTMYSSCVCVDKSNLNLNITEKFY